MRRERTPSASAAPAGREEFTSARALAASSASALVVTVRTSIGDRRKWSKDIVSSYTILRRRPPDVGFKPLITNGIELNARVVTGVCNNQWALARKLLILKTERWPSGRWRTLGKRLWRRSPSNAETPLRAIASTTSRQRMLLNVNP
jgi:hypothetical protein